MSREEGLTISAVAARTGVSVATLRAWERRHGFPTPERLAGGHRRFTEQQVDQIRAVVRDRAAGMSLDAAIGRRGADGEGSDESIFAALHRRRPGLPVYVLSKRAMFAISRAIEDECCARADRPLLVGSFQRERFYRQSERRWREYARTARATVVLADFPRTRRRARGPTEVSVLPDAPILREWAIVCDAPNAAACLAGVERTLASRGSARRRFEAVWSADPSVVRDAADAAIRIVSARDARLADLGEHLEARAPALATATLERATSLTNRIVAYIDA